MKRVIIICFAFITLFSCDDNLDRPNTNQFVIEGYLTADFPINDIKIKETISLEKDSIEDIPIDNAQVRVISGDQSVLLSYSNHTQKYFSPNNDIPITVGGEYKLEVTLDGVTATASTMVPEKPTGLSLTEPVMIIPTLTVNFLLRQQIEELFNEETITLSWDSKPGRSYFVVIENKVDAIEPVLPDIVPEDAKQFLSSFRFISEPSELTTFTIRGIALETYGLHVAKVYSINQEYLDLFNSAAQDSRDLNEPPSNVLNALGIFSAFAVDSLEFELRRF